MRKGPSLRRDSGTIFGAGVEGPETPTMDGTQEGQRDRTYWEDLGRFLRL